MTVQLGVAGVRTVADAGAEVESQLAIGEAAPTRGQPASKYSGCEPVRSAVIAHVPACVAIVELPSRISHVQADPTPAIGAHVELVAVVEGREPSGYKAGLGCASSVNAIEGWIKELQKC